MTKLITILIIIIFAQLGCTSCDANHEPENVQKERMEWQSAIHKWSESNALVTHLRYVSIMEGRSHDGGCRHFLIDDVLEVISCDDGAAAVGPRMQWVRFPPPASLVSTEAGTDSGNRIVREARDAWSDYIASRWNDQLPSLEEVMRQIPRSGELETRLGGGTSTYSKYLILDDVHQICIPMDGPKIAATPVVQRRMVWIRSPWRGALPAADVEEIKRSFRQDWEAWAKTNENAPDKMLATAWRRIESRGGDNCSITYFVMDDVFIVERRARNLDQSNSLFVHQNKLIMRTVDSRVILLDR